ncbi:hypothetical protein [Trichothermofontia sp.]
MPDVLSRYHTLLDNAPNPTGDRIDLSQPLPPRIWRNPLKVNATHFGQWLQAQGIETAPLGWYADAFRCPGWQKLGATLAFAAVQIAVKTATTNYELRTWSKLDDRFDSLGQRVTDIECFLEKTGFQLRSCDKSDSEEIAVKTATTNFRIGLSSALFCVCFAFVVVTLVAQRVGF